MAFIIPGVSRIVEFLIIFSISSTVIALILVVLFRIIKRHGAYAYTNARVSAMKKSLFRKERINPLLKSKDLQNMLNLLKDSPYSEYVRKIKDPTPEKIDEALDRHLYDSYRKISSLAPGELSGIYKEMRRIMEVRDIKTLIGAKIAGVPPEEIEGKLIGTLLSEDAYEQALEAESLEEAVSVFKDTDYWDSINEGLSEVRETGKILSLWNKVEIKYWKNVWRTIRTSSDKYASVIEKSVGMEVDIRNIITILRCKADRVNDEEIGEYIIPIYYKLSRQDIDKAIKSEDTEKAAAVFESSPYGKDISEALIGYREAGSIFVLENSLKKLLLKKIRSLAIKYYSGAGPLTGLFHEKSVEVSNLKTIANGIYEGLGSEEIKNRLVAPEVG